MCSFFFLQKSLCDSNGILCILWSFCEEKQNDASKRKQTINTISYVYCGNEATKQKQIINNRRIKVLLKKIVIYIQEENARKS